MKKKYLYSIIIIVFLALLSLVGIAFSKTVVSGDTMCGIASSVGLSCKEIIKLNPQISNPDKIYPGQEVKTEQIFGGNSFSSTDKNPITIQQVATTSSIPEGSNLLNNSSFDETPFDTGWTTSTPGSDATLTATTTIATSTQALACEMTGDDADGCIIQQEVDVSESGLNYNVYFEARANENASASTTLRLVITDAAQVYNAVDDIWEGFTQCTYASGGGWVINNVTSSVSAGYENCEMNIQVDGEGQQLSTSTFELIGSGDVVGYPSTFASNKVAIRFELFGNTGDIIYLDNVDINERAYTAFDDVEPALFNYKASSSTLRSYSKFCMINANDGCLFWMSYDYDKNEWQFYTVASSTPATATSSTY